MVIYIDKIKQIHEVKSEVVLFWFSDPNHYVSTKTLYRTYSIFHNIQCLDFVKLVI